MSNIDDIVERFNDGDYSVLEYFSGDYQTFFKFLERRKKLIEIDPKGSLADEYQNELLIYFHNTNIDVFHHWCNELLGDIEFVDGKAYVVTDPEYFADLFCDDRDVSKDTIAKILSGNLEFDWYNSYEIDIYDNVIDDLSPENLNKLKQIFLRELNGKEISTDEGEMTLSPENIDEVFNNKDLLKEILNDELSNVKSELSSLYFSSEQNALSDEYYEEVWNELDDFFYTNDRKWVTIKRGYSWDKDGSKKDRFVEMIRLPIRDFDRFVTDYLETNKRYSNSSLEYHGNYVDVLKDGGDCLRVRFPDYADSRKVRDNINDMFSDYVY
jgi:hypothetical protein